MTNEEAISRIQRALSVPNRLHGLVLIDEESANKAIEVLQDRPHGEWIQIDPIGEFKCSECEWTMIGTHKFCPNCGADMKGDTE